MIRTQYVAVILAVASLLFVPGLRAQEGMWPLNQVPTAEIEKLYHFTPTPQWILRIQRGATRLPNCSSSFVTATGVVFTNGHCAEEAVQSLSTPINNLYEKGFYAKALADEAKTTLTLNSLVSMEDVTEQASSAVSKDEKNNPAAVRSAALAKIAEDTSKKTGLKCEIVVLYQGARYDNYCYKVYADVRLYFSTPKNVWFFGGDADNFEFPRFNFDVAFLRAYENGEPAKIENHFTWGAKGVEEGDSVFIAGHPGRTERLYTSAALEAERDVIAPTLLDLFRRREIMTQQFAIRGAEEKRVSESDLFIWQNERKLYTGKIRGLQDPALIENKKKFERQLLLDAARNPDSLLGAQKGLLIVEDVEKSIGVLYPRVLLALHGTAFNTTLFDYAVSLVMMARDIDGAAKAFIEHRDAPPMNLRYEETKLVDGLSNLIEVFGAADPFVAKVMNGKGPSERAHELVYVSKLSDINEYQKFAEGGQKVVDASSDPMLQLARTVLSGTKDLRQKWADAKEKERVGYAELNDAIFKVYGTARYPDATFTLRLAYGTVRGYTDSDGTALPAWTTLEDLYGRVSLRGNQGDWKLPDVWNKRKKKADLSTPLNFVSTLDITGGNSGSPVFNKDLEIVGLLFDSNIHGLVSDYDYNYSPLARAIAVDVRGITEALRNIYDAKRLVNELTESR